MRFAAVHLRRFGPFEDAVLRFGPPEAGLQIVHGPNERGKSTALRAITALLFGFPTRTEDGFGREYSTLRVGAEIEAEGRVRGLMRRKGAQRTLFEFDLATGEERSDRPIEAAALEGWLGGVSRERFMAVHALDAPRLRGGGQSLVDARSELGALLFGATAGLTHLHEVLEKLKAEADALFLPAGRNPTLNLLISDWKQQLDRSRNAELRPADWLAREAARNQAQDSLQGVETALRGARQRLAGLDRRLGLAPQAHRLAWLRSQIKDSADAPRLDPQAREHHAALKRSLEDAARRLAEVEARLQHLQKERSALPPDAPQLGAAARILGLQARIEAAQSVRDALPALRLRAVHAAESLQDLVRALRPGGDAATAGGSIDPAECARAAQAQWPGPVVVAEARQALSERAVLQGRDASLASAQTRAEHEYAQAQAALQACPPAQDVEPLRAAVAAASAQGEIEARSSALRARLQTLTAALEAQAQVLGLPDAQTARHRLPPPSEAQAEVLNALSALAAERLRIDERRMGLQRQAERLDAERQGLYAGPDLIALDTLRALRQARDARLHEIFQHAATTDASTRTGALQAVHAADQLADVRFEQAARLSEIDSMDRRRVALEADLATAQADLAGVMEAERGLRAAWRERCMARGWPLLEPEALSDWSARHQRLSEAASEREAVRQELVALEDAISTHGQALRVAAQACGLALVPLPSLGAALILARQRLEEADAAQQTRALRQDALERAERERAGLKADAETRAAERVQATARWQVVTQGLGLSADAPVLEVEAHLERLEGLREALREWQTATQDQTQAESLLEALGAELSALAQDLGEPAPEPPAQRDWIARHVRLLEIAATVRDRRLQIDAECQGLQSSFEQSRAQQQQAQAALLALCRQAGGVEVSALGEAIARSLARQSAEEEAARIEGSLQAATGLAGPALLDELAQTSLDALQAERVETAGEVERLEGERNRLQAELTRAQSALDALDGEPTAAEAAQAMQERLAATGRVALEVARLRLARTLLVQTLGDQARQSQAPLLAAASRWLSQITGGRWMRLEPDWAEDRQVLVVIRSDGARFEPAQLSEGTADAVFLSMRMAALEVRLPAAPPVPLLLDDVLATFDDERAARTLAALAQLGRRNQVIYFTHHPHLVALAREALPAGAWSVCELVQQGPAAPQP